MTKAAIERERRAEVARNIATARELVKDLPKCRYRCRACGEESKTWAAADRHSLATKHTRIEIMQ